MAEFQSETTVAASRETVFDFLVQPKNLLLISPPDMGLKFVEVPERFSQGTEVKFLVQTFGQIQKITHQITHFSSPDLFVEELTSGPLPQWIHRHEFTPVDETTTRVTDHIIFQPPKGIIGLMMTESRIRENLEDGFHHRHQQIQKHFRLA